MATNQTMSSLGKKVFRFLGVVLGLLFLANAMMSREFMGLLSSFSMGLVGLVFLLYGITGRGLFRSRRDNQ